MNFDNDDLLCYCIAQDPYPYSIWGSLPFPDEMYEQAEGRYSEQANQF